MIPISPKLHKSKQNLGRAAWCVDSRFVLKNGQRQFFWTKADALREIDKLNAEHTPEALTSDAWKWTFAELQNKYITRLEDETLRGEKSQSCFLDRKRHTNQFINLMIDGKPVGEMLVKDLTMGQVALDIMDQLRVGRSKKTIENIFGSVGQMLLFAIMLGCRKTNPLEGVERKGNIAKAEKDKAKKIAPEIIDQIMENLSPEWRLYARFAITTGLRQGEQRALTWGCLDLEDSKVNVTRAVKHTTTKIDTTKTKSGQRTVPLTRDMVRSLKELYIRRGRPDAKALVFCSAIGTLRMPSKFLKALHRACDAAGVDRIRWHDLRHFYASKLLMAYPNDLFRVKSYLGHATIAITQSIYGHWLDTSGEDTEAVDRLSAIF